MTIERYMHKHTAESILKKTILDEVKVIKGLIRTGYTNALIARLFGVSGQSISEIKLGRNWRRVQIPL